MGPKQPGPAVLRKTADRMPGHVHEQYACAICMCNMHVQNGDAWKKGMNQHNGNLFGVSEYNACSDE